MRRTKTGLLRIDRAAAQRESHYDGKWLLRTSDLTLTAEDLAAAYKQLIAVERGWRDCKTSLGLRPVYHHREDRIRAHVQLCWLALLLIRVAETRTGDTWRNLRHELDRMHLVTLATADGRVAQRSALTGDQKTILAALDLPEPPKYLDFTPIDSAPRPTDAPAHTRRRVVTRPKPAHPAFALVNAEIRRSVCPLSAEVRSVAVSSFSPAARPRRALGKMCSRRCSLEQPGPVRGRPVRQERGLTPAPGPAYSDADGRRPVATSSVGRGGCRAVFLAPGRQVGCGRGRTQAQLSSRPCASRNSSHEPKLARVTNGSHRFPPSGPRQR